MTKLKTHFFDPATYLDDKPSTAAWMTEALESGDPAFIAEPHASASAPRTF
ncbi:MAG TPA: hypothetical protein VGF88_20485 [Acidobacteriaceae bacterium]|jgi:DNA-binding phage protein